MPDRQRPQRPACSGLRSPPRWLTAWVVICAAACSEGSEDSQAPDAGSEIVDAFDAVTADQGAEDADPVEEAGGVDTTKPPACPGGAGCPCDDNTDCDDALCLETPTGRLCAARCVDACPEGQSCRNVTGGADAQSYCVPTWGALCRPCDTNAACAQPGLAGARCVAHGDAGGFCGATCAAASDCPESYGCVSATDIAGAGTKQCVPQGEGPGGFGLCGCSAYARAKGLSTTCWLPEQGASGESLLCKGSRQCATEGLSDCAKITGAAAQCLDAQCAGKPDATSCDDGDSCTLEDACDAGVCTGAVLICACTKTADCAKQEDGDPCNGTLYCDTSGAQPKCVVNPASVVVCSTTKDSACRKNVCQAASGTCALVDAPAGKACDDGAPCSGNDACDGKGACEAGPVDLCQCQTDADCAAKEDGDACNGTLYCKKTATTAVCAVNPATVVTCPSGLDTACVTSQCQAASGLCLPSPVSATGGAAIACEDGNPCTVGEVCIQGACKASPKANKCDCGKDADCIGKNGGDLCLGELFCNVPVGKCEPNPGLAVACTTVDDTDCLKSSCDPKTGACTAKPVAKGALCDADGTACTASDACDKGVCVPGTQVCVCQSDADCADKEDGNACNGTLYCDKSGAAPQCKVNPATLKSCPSVNDTACVKNLCQPKTGQCAKTQAKDGAPCDDGVACSGGDTCVQGSCKPGVPVCPCSVDADCTKFDDTLCDGPKLCKPMPGGKTACVDAPGQAVDCGKTPVTSCQVAACAAKTGACVVSDLADGSPCPATKCAGVGSCSSGKCAAGGAVNCDDGNTCTADSCDLAAGCVHTDLVNGDCDDGSVCTAGDACAKGACSAGKPLDCATGDVCQTGSCDAKKGCQKTPSTAPCNDKDPCTLGDKCAAGKCAGTPKSCDDNNASTTDSCNATTGACVNTQTQELCDDLDNNQDGDVDEGCDDDGDGYCDNAMVIPKGGTPKVCPKGTGDCDDDAVWVYPKAVEACGNGIDDDCDGKTDEQCDADGDGYCTAEAPMWGATGCILATWPNPSCTTNYKAPIRFAAAETIKLDTGGLSGGYLPLHDEVWLVIDAAGSVKRVPLSGASAGKTVATVKTGISGLSALVGEPHADLWFGTLTDGKASALVKVVGVDNVTWRTGDTAASYTGVALDGDHVVTVDAGSAKPSLVLVDKVTGAPAGSVSLVAPANVILQGAPALAALAGRVYLPPSPSSATWFGFDLTKGNAIGQARQLKGAPHVLFGRRGRLCAMTKTTQVVTCEVVANFDCWGDDCLDSVHQVSPGQAEVAGDGADNDCDGLADETADPDADGVCPDKSCGLRWVDSCPGVWNPTNDPSKCRPATASAGDRRLPLQLGATQSSWATSKRARLYEPVEVPLVNGLANSDVIAHWWGVRSAPVAGTSASLSVGSSPTFVDAHATGDHAGLPMGEGAKSLVVKDSAKLLEQAQRELTLGGWFKVSGKVSSGVLIHLRSKIIADLEIVGANTGYGTPKAHLSLSKGTPVVKGLEELSAGWHHLAMVFTGTELRLHVDGVLVDSAQAPGTPNNQAASQRTFSIGGKDTSYNGQADSKLVPGHTAEVLVLSRALSPAEVQAWASSRAVYGSPRTPGARLDFDDVRVVEQAGNTERHVPFALVGAAPHPAAQTHQVAARWDFDGLEVRDRISGTGSVLQAGAKHVLGRSGEPLGAVQVGGGAVVDLKVTEALSFADVTTASATVAFWVKLSTPGSSGTLLGTESSAGGISLHVSQGKLFAKVTTDKSSITYASSADLPTGRWTHVALTLDAATAAIYIDGWPEGGAKFTITGKVAPGQSAYLGAKNVNGKALAGLSGAATFDDVVIHHRALTAAEVRDRAVGLPRVRFVARTAEQPTAGAWPMHAYSLRWGGSTLRPEPTQTKRLADGSYVVCDGVLSSCMGYRALWRFDHSLGQHALDLSGAAHHGVPSDTGQLGPGVSTAALWMSATRHMTAPGATLAQVDDFSVDARFTVGPTSNPVLLSLASAGSIELEVAYEKGSAALSVRRGTVKSTWPMAMVSNTFAAASVTRASGAVNVTLDGAPAAGVKTMAGVLDPSKATFNIGNIAPTPTASRQFDGGIDVVRVMDRAVRASESLPTVPLRAWGAWPTVGKVVVPTRRFVQGCDKATYANCGSTEGPSRVVWTRRFAIDATEVTAADYAACVTAGACKAAATGSTCTGGNANKTTHPANCIDRAAAASYCAWRGGALPTEAQWGHAARGSCGPNSLTDGQCSSVTGAKRLHPWGDTAGTCNEANHWPTGASSSCKGGTQAVGTLPAGRSLYGALDMAGNVNEFVRDNPGDLSKLPTIDPVQSAGSGVLVLGGGYLANAKHLVISYRSSQPLAHTNSQTGFRCAY